MSDRPTRTEISAIDSSIDVSFGTVYETGEGLSTAIIANVYDNTATYAVGNYVIESKKLYKCITAVTEPEDFDSEKWEITKVGNEIEELSEEIESALTDKMDKVNPTGSGSLSIGRKANTTASLHSIALGNNVTASAAAAFAEGSGTVASAADAHAEGQNTEAKGQHSHAEGGITVAQGIASHAEGAGSLARGVASHAEGDGTTAKGDYSHAEGHFTTAKHRAQHVFGEFNIIDSSEAEPTERGTYVEIVGNGDSGTNERSNARTLDWDGNEVLAGDLTINGSTSVTTALGSKADANNVYTKAQVDTALSGKLDSANPVATGSLSLNRKADTNIGDNSVALGYDTTASYASAIAEGFGTEATDLAAHAEGYYTYANGEASHSEGSDTHANGEASHAEGRGAQADGDYSHAEGYATIAGSANQHVFGKFNEADTEEIYAEVVGNGVNASNRANARTLDWYGNETLAGDLTINGSTSVSGALSNKADANSVYTKAEVDNKIAALPEPMVLKGTLGVNGTIQSLPTPSATNEGWTFKCITASTYSGITLKVGDTVTCFNPPSTSTYEWFVSGYGDTDTDTWRNIKVNGVEKLGNGLSSGGVDFVDTTNIKMSFDGNANAIKATLDGVYTSTQADQKFPTKNDIEDTSIAGALYHLGFYLDENGGLCQVNSI